MKALTNCYKWLIEFTKRNEKVILSFLLLLFSGYGTFYIRDALTRREYISRTIANFYSSAAAEFYAAQLVNNVDDKTRNEPYYVMVLELEDKHYIEFLNSSTQLAAEVPPDLRNEILSIEQYWVEIREKNYNDPKIENEWFRRIDSLREKILESIKYSKFLDPGWR